MRRGEFCFLVLCILFAASVPVQGIPLHENFEDTSPDLLSVIASLSEVKSLCEESLLLSFDARGNLTFTKHIVMVFSNETLMQSLQASRELQENLSSFSGYLETLRDHAESYLYLRDMLVPFQALGFNVTLFVKSHQSILENLTTSVNFINEGGDAKEAVVALGNIRSAVTAGRGSLQTIEQYTTVLQGNYSVDTLQTLIASLYPILESYDAYSTSLLELYTDVEPHLMLFSTETVISLGETIHVYGYFFAQREFVSDQMIDIQARNHTLNTIMADGRGGFTAAIPISLDHPLGTLSILASTTYHHKVYHSEVVEVTVQLIPTTLTFFTNATHVYLNESFRIFGRLFDDHNRGIHAIVTTHIAALNRSVETDETGNYTAVVNETLAFGVYPIFVSFTSNPIYAPCKSPHLIIAVDTPTMLTLFTSATRVSAGDTVLCTGQLTSLMDGSPVSQQPIAVVVNNNLVRSGITNATGWYTVGVPTRSLAEGVALVSARFTAAEPRWRNATSNEVALTIVMMFPYWDTLIIITVVAALVPVFFFFRRRIITLGTKKPLRVPSVVPKAPVSPLPLESHSVNKRALLEDISSSTEGDIREAIILRYHLLLRLLTSSGMIFSPSSTHLDIKTVLIQKGLSKDATESITDLFELAQYSPYPLGAKEAALFTANLHVLVKTLGGDSWIPQ